MANKKCLAPRSSCTSSKNSHHLLLNYIVQIFPLATNFDVGLIKVRGQWKYLYRAVDKHGDTIDFLLTARRDTKAALRFLRQAIGNNATPVKINIDKSGANTAAIGSYNKESGARIEIRQCKNLNNIVEQDHRRVKQKTPAALEFKAFYSAHATLVGA